MPATSSAFLYLFIPRKCAIFVLTEKGRKYAEIFFCSLASIEEASVKRFGYEKMQMLTELMKEYQEILASCVEQEAGGSRDGNKQ